MREPKTLVESASVEVVLLHSEVQWYLVLSRFQLELANDRGPDAVTLTAWTQLNPGEFYPTDLRPVLLVGDVVANDPEPSNGGPCSSMTLSVLLGSACLTCSAPHSAYSLRQASSSAELLVHRPWALVASMTMSARVAESPMVAGRIDQPRLLTGSH